jgi:hypothetical protein
VRFEAVFFATAKQRMPMAEAVAPTIKMIVKEPVAS